MVMSDKTWHLVKDTDKITGFIGGTKDITTMIKTRSSVGRCGISICLCAGSGDVGYVNRWTLEITNHSSYTIPLRPGMRIGQMLFFKTLTPPISEYSGKYNITEQGWKPEDMLPKLHMD